MKVAAPENAIDELLFGRERRAMGPPRVLLERGLAAAQREPTPPFVSGLPADPEQRAQRSHRQRPTPALNDELQFLLHRTGLFPGHLPLLPVSDVSGLRCQRCPRFGPGRRRLAIALLFKMHEFERPS